jgi:excinuclease UvrABC ATPase subunit
VVTGTPEQVAQCEFSHTGYWLNKVLTARREVASEVVA